MAIGRSRQDGGGRRRIHGIHKNRHQRQEKCIGRDSKPHRAKAKAEGTVDGPPQNRVGQGAGDAGQRPTNPGQRHQRDRQRQQ